MKEYLIELSEQYNLVLEQQPVPTKPTALQRTGKFIKSGLQGAANVATGGAYDAVKNAAQAASGNDPESQMQALKQKDQGHDQMDQQNVQTDQSQEQRIASLEQKLAELEQLLAGQSAPAPAAPVDPYAQPAA
jgi:hypothetical protein